MGSLFNIVKGFVFAFNLISVIIGFATLVIDAVGVKHSTPGTDGHAFFILGILLCGLLVMTTIVGCYGICSEILGVNVIYSIFMLSLLIIQYLQIRSFQPHGIYFHTLQDLEMAWRMVGTDPTAMDDIQMRLGCCGLFNEQDYAFKHLPVPSSCQNALPQEFHQRGCLDAQWKSHIIVSRRQQLFNWALLVSEALTLIYSIILCILIRRRRYRNSHNIDGRLVVPEVIQHNNVGSRHLLL